ncbi:velvet factor-domain-containing protein [Hygrophoropsis aurantiaca]|uniref:Velvet factor-domain-containing protein n=1 Tax=Hygrophoropsis aurantiaca TaxID=72124 RepID=A0ACB8AHW5_9AGAM|nr:velvet factor-domain-containing protein [Hygrophoropsis aurantiaca]
MDFTQPRRTTISYINNPIQFIAGQFEGQTIRAELVEIQKADLGRKYARVDRRPLDPPPVVQLKLYQVYNHGTSQQYEREMDDYDDVQNLGLLCNVDLFPVPNEGEPSPQPSSYPEPLASNYTPHPATSYLPCGYQPAPHLASDAQSYHPMPMAQLPPLTVPARPNGIQMRSYARPPVVITHFGPHPITEDMKCTTSLSGATFIQPASFDYQGKKALMFVFADLAVKIEGYFFLRYRFFDIFSRIAGHEDLPVQAECYGGSFRVYSTKEFPGLSPSTELTKQLARFGVRLNIRETERKRKRKNNRSISPSACPKGKRRTNAHHSDSDFDQ